MAKLLVLAVCAALMVGWAQGQWPSWQPQENTNQYTRPAYTSWVPQFPQGSGTPPGAPQFPQGSGTPAGAPQFLQGSGTPPGAPQFPQGSGTPLQVPVTPAPTTTTPIPTTPQVDYPQVTKKPNDCPAKPRGYRRYGCYGYSQDVCGDDSSCPGIQKCCDSGCGKTCQNPECPRNKPMAQCRYNPCDYSDCYRYRYRDVVCVPDYCGGCYARWIYKGRKDVTSRCNPEYSD